MIVGWEDPKQSWIGLRCSEEKWAKAFVEKGSILFGTAQKWVDEAKKSIGRGDPYEGLIAITPEVDTRKLLELRKKHPGLTEDVYGGQIILRSERDMHLPAFCYYSVSNDLFKCPEEPGEYDLTEHITEDYFKDFKDPDPGFVMFCLKEFHDKLKTWLIGHGVPEEAILIQKVQYYEMKPGMWLELNGSQPYELFYKAERFKIQQEDRIVINTDDKAVLDLLSKPIEIGSLEGIADSADHAEMEQSHGLEVHMHLKLEAR